MHIWSFGIFAYAVLYLFAIWLAATTSGAEKFRKMIELPLLIMCALLIGSLASLGHSEQQMDEYKAVASHDQWRYHSYTFFKTEYMADTVVPAYCLDILHPTYVLSISYTCKEQPMCRLGCGHFEKILVATSLERQCYA